MIDRLAWFTRRIALAAIRVYQVRVSPYKGFCCAYRQHTGRASCSELGRRAIRRRGLLQGLAVLRRRMARCGVVHRRTLGEMRRLPASQRGVCDLGCDLPCDLDLPDGRGLSRLCDLASCCDCGSCDWPDRKNRRRREQDRQVYIPPWRRGPAR